MLLLSLLLDGLFAAMCVIVCRSKGYSAVLGAVTGFLGGLIPLIIFLLLPDRTQELDDNARLDQELSALRLRVAALERMQQSSEEPVSLVKPFAPEPAAPPDAPAVFPARTEEIIACPRCGRRQKGNRSACYACGLPFQYETE